MLYSPSTPTTGRKLLQAPAVDLTNATTIASILTIAAQSAPSQSDAATRAALTQNLSGAQILAVSQAVANVNAIVAAATDAATVQKAQYYTSTQVNMLTIIKKVSKSEQVLQCSCPATRMSIALN